ncbi:hypothetical protein VPNG_00410 [Cytospora leucostoma]|uniref:Dihydrolipoamide acetyltransferase component of pyruvate dehydrogenase complex n=1 Tax=Cytospora leucostoma TaxID=1230097 RepID=A0A423XNZ5_9PEZI|nr:hypothetical protein VPNG_00410 [Cytospora leucostoma]
MFLRSSSRALRSRRPLAGRILVKVKAPPLPRLDSPKLSLADFLLLGIVECEIIQWFVEPEARVEEFSPLCEVQSDKASVEITSRFSGVVKKLHYETGEMAKVGKPFVDIDILGDVDQEALDKLTPLSSEAKTKDEGSLSAPAGDNGAAETPASKPRGKHAGLATPAVRHLSKDLKLDILDVDGTGRDGRVLKEDIYRFIKARDNAAASPPPPPPPPPPSSSTPPSRAISDVQTETRKPLTKTQEQMFKIMTRSLNIPHFLYADEVDFSELAALRGRLNKVLSSTPSSPSPSPPPPPPPPSEHHGVTKLSYLPFVIKAVSLALQQYPVLNARVDAGPGPPGASGASVASVASKPALVYRAQHNIGVAMDTPQGLLVPVIRDVASRSILAIAAELSRLQRLAAAGRLAPGDMSGGTVTVSNIGSIGGTYCSPVIVEGQVAILGVGRLRDVPDVVAADGVGGGAGAEWRVRGVRRVCNFSWSADHRVVDGATMARAAGVVRSLVEEPDVMVMYLR